MTSRDIETQLADTDVVDPDPADLDGPDPDGSEAEPDPAAGGFSLTPDEPGTGGGGRWLAVIAALVAVGLAVGGVLWWQGSRPQPTPSPAPVAAPQHSLFIAVATPDNKVYNGLYYATGDRPSGLVAPGSLLIDVPTLGQAPLSDALPLGVDVAGSVFTDATGLTVETSWAVPMEAMATLIDKVGGVTVDVDVPVTANGLELQIGRQQSLNGQQAMTFATWTGTGEAPSLQLARMNQVATTLIATLPDDEPAIEALLAEVPGGTTDSASELAARLAQVRAGLGSSDYSGSLLPVTPNATPAVPAGVVVDQTALASVIKGRLDGLRTFTPGAAGIVHLQNASGVESMDLPARRRLIDLGFDYSYQGLAEPAVDTTIVMVLTQDQLPAGRRVVKDLGLPNAHVVVAPIVPGGVDALVLLGSDFTVVAQQSSGDDAAPTAGPSEAATEGADPTASEPTATESQEPAAEPEANAEPTP